MCVYVCVFRYIEFKLFTSIFPITFVDLYKFVNNKFLFQTWNAEVGLRHSRT